MSDARLKRVTPGYRLHPYQRQVLGDLLGVLGPERARNVASGRRVVAHLPTGAGKTRIACHVASYLLNLPESEGKVVVWLASSEELCEQAAEDLTTAWSNLGNREVEVHRYWGSVSQSLDDLGEGFLVAGLPKLWAVGSSKPGFLTKLARSVAGVIFDEAHQAVARTYRFITEQLVAFQPPLLGLTATPGRSYRLRGEDYDLAEMFHESKVTIDPQGHGSPVTYLTRQGYLAEPEFIPVTVEMDTRIPEPIDVLDYRTEDLQEIGHDQIWKAKVVELSLAALKRHHRVMVFCPSVRCAEEAAHVVSEHGARGRSIVAGTPSDQRNEVIAAFRRGDGESMALFNYGVLTAGFDAPRTKCVIVARPTTSLVLYSQMVGRAMRGPRSGGNRRCQVYTVLDTNLPSFGSVVEAFNNWEELWLNQQQVSS